MLWRLETIFPAESFLLSDLILTWKPLFSKVVHCSRGIWHKGATNVISKTCKTNFFFL